MAQEDQTGDVASALEPDDTSAALGGSSGAMDISQYDPSQTVAGTAGGTGAAAPAQDPRNDPRLVKLQEEGINLRQDAVENAKRMVSSMEQDRQNRPPPPQLQSVPKAPEAKLGEGAREWMMVASLLGALAGTRARGSTTAALNAFSGAIQGFHDGKLEQFKTQSQEWKQASDQVISDNQEKLQQYRALLEDNKMNLDQKMEEYKIVASIYGDQISYNLADQRNYTLLGQAYQKDVNNTLRMEKATADLTKTQLQIEKMTDDAKDAKEARNDKMLDFYADQMNKTGKMPSVGYGKNAGQIRAAIAQRAQERAEAKGQSGADVAEGQIGYKAETAGATTQARRAQTLATNVENATNEVAQLIPQAMATSAKLPRKKLVPLNQLIQAYQSGTSDPAYNDFVVANFALVNAYTRAMNPQGIPRINDEQRQHAIGLLSTATSPQAYEVQVRRLWAEVLASRKATQETIKGEGPTGDFPGGPPPAKDQEWGRELRVH
jgi:hypothetical protein